MRTKNLILVPMGSKVPKWGPTWEQCLILGYFFWITLLGGEQALTPSLYLKSFDMDSVQVGKAVFGKEIYTTLGIEQWTFLKMGISLPEKKCQCLDFNVSHILNLAPA